MWGTGELFVEEVKSNRDKYYLYHPFKMLPKDLMNIVLDYKVWMEVYDKKKNSIMS